MLKNPDIVLLDEPTAALDSINEEQISIALNNLFKNKTVVVIAHRLQTVKNADKISQMIKQKYENTEWFVLCCEKSSGNNEDFDFKFTYFENNNTLILCEKKVLFYICKL